MAYLLISLLCVLAATKVTLQSRFSKTQNRSVTDSVFYNGIMFLTVATLFCPWLMANGATVTTIVFGVLMGILSVAFQLLYLCAFSKGKMSLTVILNNFSMIIPMAVSLLAFDEPFGLAKAAGTVLALVSFCLIVAREKRGQETEGKNGAAWLILTLLVFLVNGLISVNQKLYAESVDNLQVFEFVAVSYITAAALSFLILGVLGMREKRFPASGGKNVILSACLVGLVLGVFQALNTYAASVIPGTVLYSTYNCGTSVLLCVIGRLLFREKLSKKQYIGVTIGIAAIVCLCL